MISGKLSSLSMLSFLIYKRGHHRAARLSVLLGRVNEMIHIMISEQAQAQRVTESIKRTIITTFPMSLAFYKRDALVFKFCKKYRFCLNSKSNYVL